MKISRVAIKIKRFALKLKNNTLRNFFTYYKYSKCSEDRVATFIRIWESFIFVWKILLEPSVSSSIDDKKKKKKKKELYSQRMESQYFNGKKYVFKACLLEFLLISFIESSPSVRKLSRKSWFLEAAEYRFYNCFENFSNISFFSFHRSCLLSSRWVKSSPRRIPRKRINISKTCLHQFVEKL